MSGHNINAEQFNAAVAGSNLLDDPGTAGIIDLQGKSNATLVLAAATTSVTLPTAYAGVQLLVIGTAAQTVKAPGAGSTVATLADGESTLLVCHGSVWASVGAETNKQTGAT